MIHSEKSPENIVTLTFDSPGRSANVLDDAFLAAFREGVEGFLGDPTAAGLILTSSKRDFVLGADIDTLGLFETAEQVFDWLEGFKALLRRMETCGRPVVAALNGTTLGGGYEMALACHHRVALKGPKIKIGLPEVKLGLVPGGGGTQRLSRLIGIQKAIPLLVKGRGLSPEQALVEGLVQELASTREELLAKAKAWIGAHPQAAQPWDQEGYRWPGGRPDGPVMTQFWAIAPSVLNKETYGNYPAPLKILSCVHEGSKVDFDTASRIESRYAASCVSCPVSTSLINALWVQMKGIENGESRPATVEQGTIRKLGILGAGLMGSGIAYVSARAGIDVVLKDLDQDRAQQGKAFAAEQLDRLVAKGRMDETQRTDILGRITATGDAADLKGCDLVVEAVFEDRDLKGKATAEAEAHMSPSSIFASNTSTLPITGLAAASVRPERFIGLHFFSPVERMQLVEIIVGEKTSDETLAGAYDYVQQIGKTPIVVRDVRGFFTSRVFEAYVLEGMSLVGEGQDPRLVESAARQAGLPIGPLALMDDVSLRLMWEVLHQTRRDREALGLAPRAHPGIPVVDRMVNGLQRLGKKAGGGFYEYPQGGKRKLWPGLKEHFPPQGEALSQEELIDRLLFAQVLEAVRAVEEGVVRVADANVGSILGWGFPAFKGGVIHFINDHGVAAFAHQAQVLAERFGPRFAPPELLIEKAERNEAFV